MNRPNTRRGFGPFPVTAYGIDHVGLCHVSGAHLSEAPNETFAQIHEQEQAAARTYLREANFRDANFLRAERLETEALARKNWIES